MGQKTNRTEKKWYLLGQDGSGKLGSLQMLKLKEVADIIFLTKNKKLKRTALPAQR